MIYDPLALDADQMWMGAGFFPVIAIVITAELKFQHFPSRLQNSQGLVHSSYAGSREVRPYRSVNFLCAGMPFALSEDLEYGRR